MNLPDQFFENNTLENMKVGQSGFIVPWGMFVQDGQCFLNGNYPYDDHPDGTAQLKITRAQSGYIAHIYEMHGDHKWSEGGCFMGEFTPLRVVGFTIKPEPKNPAAKVEKGFFKKLLNWIKRHEH